jgi:hypothetical protein
VKPRQLIMALALLGAGALLIWGQDEEAVPEVRSRPERRLTVESRSEAPQLTSPARPRSGTTAENAGVLRLRPREAPPRWDPDGGGPAGLFASHSWEPPPPPVAPAPPPPPTAPPLPYTYVGKKLEAGAWEVYLARGDQVLVVRPDTVIENTYRVGAILPPTLNLTYLPLNQLQPLSIGAPD